MRILALIKALFIEDQSKSQERSRTTPPERVFVKYPIRPNHILLRMTNYFCLLAGITWVVVTVLNLKHIIKVNNILAAKAFFLIPGILFLSLGISALYTSKVASRGGVYTREYENTLFWVSTAVFFVLSLIFLSAIVRIKC
jgi:magnesium-transporting ATPase (P-type)